MLIFYYAKLNYMAFMKSLSPTEMLVSCHMQINFKEMQLDMYYMMISANFVFWSGWLGILWLDHLLAMSTQPKGFIQY